MIIAFCRFHVKLSPIIEQMIISKRGDIFPKLLILFYKIFIAYFLGYCMSLVIDFEESANFSDDAAAKSKDADNKNKSRGNRAPGANIG